MRRGFGLLVVSFLVAATVLAATDFWREKDYGEWSVKECERLLAQSPWSHPHALTSVRSLDRRFRTPGPDVVYRLGQVGAYVPDGFEPGDREVHLFLQTRFLTARPIQAAVARLRVLDDPDDPTLRVRLKDAASRPDPAEIVVDLRWFSRPAGHSFLRDIEAFFRDATIDSLRNRCYLSSSETKTYLPISAYRGPEEGFSGALLSFPRFDESGAPHFTGSEGTILLRMETDFGTIERPFSPREMFFDGEFTI